MTLCGPSSLPKADIPVRGSGQSAPAKLECAASSAAPPFEGPPSCERGIDDSMIEPTKAVFLSYASQDAEAARRIREALRAGGIEVWFDQTELRGGDAWDRKIRRQIHDCALFIPIISATTQGREEGYFRREWKLAVDRTHDRSERRAFLVPVAIDDTGDAEADVPEAFRSFQWTRLPAGETPPAFVARVSQLLSPSESQAPAQAQPSTPSFRPPAPSTAASRRSRFLLLLMAAVALMAAGYFALDKFVLSMRPTAGTRTTASIGQATAPGQRAISEKSIAVLPFMDMSEKKDQEYFGDGMAEEILNLLVKVPGLKVIGRTSSFQFKGKSDDLRKIGTALEATFVVEGSVRRSGDQVRVTAQLIDTRDGTHRWSETYDRDASNVLKVQTEIATSLARALQLEVAGSVLSQSRLSPRNTEAYDSYLRGLHALDRRDQPGLEEAFANFQHALDLDPAFTPAAEALARARINLAAWAYVPAETGWNQARLAAEAALKLDQGSAIGHTVLGGVHTEYDWDWVAAADELKTALAIAPNNPTALLYAADQRLAVGQWSEGARFLDAAIAADPLDAELYVERGLVYVRMGRLTEAESACRRVLEISPTFAWAHYYLGVVLLTERRADAALAEMQKETLEGMQLAGLAVVYQSLHRSKDADAALARLEAGYAGDMALEIAEAYAFRGRKDQAFAWLDKAYAQKDINLFYMKGDPLLKNLEKDPRYKTFLRKMKLPD